MFGKVKKWLGIEGVKVELILPPEVRRTAGVVKGKVRFYSLHAQTVTSLRLEMIERYSRGREDQRLVDEYKIGAINLERQIEVPAGEAVELGFELPFQINQSKMDEIASQNPLMGGLVKVGKWFSKVNSEYRIEVEANTLGVALHPFDKKIINVR